MSKTKRSHGLRDGKTTKHAKSCENNKGCPYCESNRLHKHRKKMLGEKIVNNKMIFFS